MRTIRWRNGQWAERIAHAGSEAVRLVPFSSLPAVILDYLLSECCVSAWRLPLCRDAVRINRNQECSGGMEPNPRRPKAMAMA